MLGALFGFNGRLSRPGFWEVLFSIVLIDLLLVLGRMYVADSGLPGGFGPASTLSQGILAVAPWVLAVFTVWSLLAAMIKRCHDRGRSGALILVGLIPVIGWLWLLIDLFVLEGEERHNRHGRPAHAPAVEPAARQGFDWGADPVASPAPEFAAAPSAPHTSESPAPEPAPIDAGAVDVHVQEAPAAVWEPGVPLVEPVAVHEPQPIEATPEPQVPPVEDVHAEAPEEHQPELALSLAPQDHKPADDEHDRSDLRPLMLDSI